MESQSASRSIAARWPALAVAAAIVAGGCWLRFDHIGGPYAQPDEPVACYVVSRVLSSGNFDTNWAHTQVRVEGGVPQYNFSSYFITLSLLERLRGMTRPHPEAETIEERIVFYRGCSAAFGTLALALAMLLAYRIRGWRLALVAGLWMAVNPLLVQDSHYARPEAFLTLLTLGLLWTCLSWHGAPGRRSFAAGLLFGLLIACKVTLSLWFWLPLMACFQGAGEWTRCTWRTRLARAGLVAAGAIGGFAAGAPRAVADLGGYLNGLRYLKNGYAGTFNFYSHDSGAMVWDFLGRYLVATAGWGLACLFAAGAAHAAARRQWRQLLMIYLPAVSLVAFMGVQRSFFERNLSHAIPLYLLGAGLGLAALTEWDPLRRWSRPLFAAFAVAAALAPAALTGRLVLEGFPGRFEKLRVSELAGILASIKPRVPDAAHLVTAASDRDLWFQRRWEVSPATYVVLWQDVNPEVTRECLRRLHERFEFEELAVLPGLFDDLPGPNTLRDYLGRTVRVLVFHGVRGSPPGADGSRPPR